MRLTPPFWTTTHTVTLKHCLSIADANRLTSDLSQCLATIPSGARVLLHQESPDGEAYTNGLDVAVMEAIPSRPDVTFVYLTEHAYELKESVNDHIGTPYYDPYSALKNLWLGVVVKTQADVEERVPLLLETNAKVRFIVVIPCEPLDLSDFLHPTLCFECGHVHREGEPLVYACSECDEEQTNNERPFMYHGEDYACEKCGATENSETGSGALNLQCPKCHAHREKYCLCLNDPSVGYIQCVVAHGAAEDGSVANPELYRPLRDQCASNIRPHYHHWQEGPTGVPFYLAAAGNIAEPLLLDGEAHQTMPDGL